MWAKSGSFDILAFHARQARSERRVPQAEPLDLIPRNERFVAHAAGLLDHHPKKIEVGIGFRYRFARRKRERDISHKSKELVRFIITGEVEAGLRRIVRQPLLDAPECFNLIGCHAAGSPEICMLTGSSMFILPASTNCMIATAV